jgi:hypothetical protein
LQALTEAGIVSIISDGFRVLTPLRIALRQRFVTVSLNPISRDTMGLVAVDGGGLQLYRLNVTTGVASPVPSATIPVTTNVQCKTSASALQWRCALYRSD